MESESSGTSKKEIEAYYDQFREHQKKLGLNVRHRTILRNVRREGLQHNSSVLEIGCGIGTVSYLLLRTVKTGKFLGVDISPESIALAKQLNKNSANARFLVSDMSDFTSDDRFDFIVFPDVLEHIPQEQHAALFKTVASVSNPEATIVINIPEPNYLNYTRINHPEKLQIIDQSLDLRQLVNNAYDAGFEISRLEPYGLQYNAPEYLNIVFRRSPVKNTFPRKSFLRRFAENFYSKLAAG